MDESTQTQFNGYALVEIMGHRRAAGFVTTEYIGASAFLRIVTPEVPPTRVTLEKDSYHDFTQLYAGSVIEISRPRAEILVGSASIYAITPIEEGEVLAHAPLTKTVIERAPRASIMGPAESQDDSDRLEPDDDEGPL